MTWQWNKKWNEMQSRLKLLLIWSGKLLCISKKTDRKYHTRNDTREGKQSWELIRKRKRSLGLLAPAKLIYEYQSFDHISLLPLHTVCSWALHKLFMSVWRKWTDLLTEERVLWRWWEPLHLSNWWPIEGCVTPAHVDCSDIKLAAMSQCFPPLAIQGLANH